MDWRRSDAGIVVLITSAKTSTVVARQERIPIVFTYWDGVMGRKWLCIGPLYYGAMRV